MPGSATVATSSGFHIQQEQQTKEKAPSTSPVSIASSQMFTSISHSRFGESKEVMVAFYFESATIIVLYFIAIVVIINTLLCKPKKISTKSS